MSGARIASVREVRFARHGGGPAGVLTVFPGDEPGGVPFPIARVFAITGVAAGETRGHHAHRACAQLVVCLAGAVEVRVDDGRDARAVTLDSSASGLLIPPGLWNVLRFATPETVVAVFCDRPYEEHDYVRDRAAYLREQAAT